MLGSAKWSFAWWLAIALAAGVAVQATVPAIARPTPGYGDLIDSYCISQGRLRVAAHQSHCAMCHQTGTFDDRPDHRVEPNWTEFERGKAMLDFGYFCPSQASAVPPPNPSPSTAPPAAGAPSSPYASAPSAQAPLATVPSQSMGMEREGGAGHRAQGSGMSMGPPNTMGTMAPPSLPMNMGSPAPSAAPSTIGSSAQAAAPPDRPPMVPAEVEQRLTRLRDELRIGDSQQADWNVLAEAVRAAAARHREFAETASPPPSISADAVALLQLQQRRMSARIAAIRWVSTAFTRLLAGLDENQRKIANERFSKVLEAM